MKVVINVGHGGFDLSPLAIKEIAKRKGKKCYFFEHDFDNNSKKKFKPILIEEADSYSTMLSIPNPNDYDNPYDYSLRYSLLDTERNDVDLIAVIEEFGEKANGDCCALKIIEIPDNIEWLILEDSGTGIEYIAEKHRTWN